MLRFVFVLLIIVPMGLSYAVTYEEVQQESGAKQLLLLEQYLAKNAATDASKSLALLNSISPQTLQQASPLQRHKIQLYQSKALLLEGNVDESLAQLNNSFDFAITQKMMILRPWFYYIARSFCANKRAMMKR